MPAESAVAYAERVWQMALNNNPFRCGASVASTEGWRATGVTNTSQACRRRRGGEGMLPAILSWHRAACVWRCLNVDTQCWPMTQ